MASGSVSGTAWEPNRFVPVAPEPSNPAFYCPNTNVGRSLLRLEAERPLFP